MPVRCSRCSRNFGAGCFSSAGWLSDGRTRARARTQKTPSDLTRPRFSRVHEHDSRDPREAEGEFLPLLLLSPSSALCAFAQKPSRCTWCHTWCARVHLYLVHVCTQPPRSERCSSRRSHLCATCARTTGYGCEWQKREQTLIDSINIRAGNRSRVTGSLEESSARHPCTPRALARILSLSRSLSLSPSLYA